MSHANRLDIQHLRSLSAELLGNQLNEQRFLFVPGSILRNVLDITSADFLTFSEYWSDLKLDRYMADCGTYRYRRYGEFSSSENGKRTLLPHGPYEQPKYINSLNGGVARLFDPLEPGFVQHPLLNRLLDWLTQLCDQCEGTSQRWNIRLHPYRIVASAEEVGNPTPEGLHRDGVDYIASLLISRVNVEGGQSTVTDHNRQTLWQRVMQVPLDILIGLDALTMHSVTPITPITPTQEAWRDVLVIAFTKETP